MKKYVCKACRHTWSSPDPVIECVRFGCGSRRIEEIPVVDATDATSENATSEGVTPRHILVSRIFGAITAVLIVIGMSLWLFGVPADREPGQIMLFIALLTGIVTVIARKRLYHKF